MSALLAGFLRRIANFSWSIISHGKVPRLCCIKEPPRNANYDYVAEVQWSMDHKMVPASVWKQKLRFAYFSVFSFLPSLSDSTSKGTR